MLTLGDDWDGKGALAPGIGVLRAAAELIGQASNALPPPARIVASPTGSIVVEWEVGGSYLEAEIEEPGRAEWMLEEQGRYHHWETRWHILPQEAPWDSAESTRRIRAQRDLSDSAVAA
jgi:hypothetical protein